jgi:hypothetical protein
MLPDERKAVLTNVNADMVAQIVESLFLNKMNLQVSPGGTAWVLSHDQWTALLTIARNSRPSTLLSAPLTDCVQCADRDPGSEFPGSMRRHGYSFSGRQ